MNTIGEISSVKQSNSYQGQGSSVKAPQVAEKVEKAEVSSLDKFVKKDAVFANSKVDEKNNKKDQVSEKETEGNNGANSSLKEAVSQINSVCNSCEAIFGIHEGTNRVMIKMVDKVTKEVIREYPAEKTLDLIAKAWEMAGIMVDEKR